MKSDNLSELFPIVDVDGHVLGSATRGVCHSGSRLLHPVVHLHIFNHAGELYLQRRPGWKDIQPGKWDTAVGGHVGFGEEIADALLREAREEVGLTGFEPRFIGRYVFESDCECELVNVFKTTVGCQLTPSDELDGGRFWAVDEIEAHIGAGIFTPNFEQEYIRLLSFSKSSNM